MAMLPEVHLNFGPVTFERIYQIFLPLVPGATIVGGLVLVHPQRFHDVQVALGVGRYSRVAILISAAYISGLVLYGFSVTVTQNCSALLVGTVFTRWPPKRPNDGPAKAWVWRRAAAEFLGPALSPQALTGNDIEWQDLYNVLQDYVLRGIGTINNEFYLLMMHLQAAAWALFYLYWRSALRGHWSVLVVCLALIFSSVTIPFAAHFFYWKFDRLTGWDFTARLINEIRMREKSVAPPPAQS